MVESRMGAVAWGLRPSPRFPSPLIKPDVPISGIRLSGWLHRKAHDGPLGASVRSTDGLRLCLAIELSLKGPDLFRRCQAHRQSPSPHHRQKRTRSQGHWDRNRARSAVGEGFPLLLFRLQDGFTVPPWLTFPEAPL